jgi:3-deoxy-manno-octulosonate cytidylyltransferase (CMP-KDO synthetase)
LRTAIVIPARLQSARLPGKVLADIGGRPMLEWVWRAACAVRVASVWIASDSAAVLEAAEHFGARTIATAQHHVSGTDRVAEAAEQIEADAILNLQGDEPFISPAALEALIEGFARAGSPMATLVTPLTDGFSDPSRVKAVARRDGRALYFSRASIPFDREGEGAPPLLHVGVYIYSKEFLRIFTRLPVGRLERAEKLEQLRALEHGYDIALVEVDYSGTSVDMPADLERARLLAASRLARGAAENPL